MQLLVILAAAALALAGYNAKRIAERLSPVGPSIEPTNFRAVRRVKMHPSREIA
jgi:hypothetical protein